MSRLRAFDIGNDAGGRQAPAATRARADSGLGARRCALRSGFGVRQPRPNLMRRGDNRRLSVDGRLLQRLWCGPMADTDTNHPGAIVRQLCLERFNLSVTEGASVLGVSRQALTNLLSGKAGISPEMALRLDKAFGGGAETWLQRQLVHDLAKARKRLDELDVVSMAQQRQRSLF